MSNRLTWMLKTLFVVGIIGLLNYPIAFAICHDITPHYTTLITTILIISLLYGFSTLCGPHHFHAILIGLLAGNLISILTWVTSFRDIVFHFSDPDKLSTYYSLGIFLPAMVQFFLSVKRDRSETARIHIVLTTGITLYLLGFLIFRLTQIHDSDYFNLFHFCLGLSVGFITACVIHFILMRNLLVFQKLSLYLEVMLKPIMAFFLGYLLIMFTFTGLYTLAYFSDPKIFNHLSHDVFGELMFYSFSTITGIGFSIIEPEKPLALFLTTTENFLGLVWITVVFAAALAHLQAPFRRISHQLDKMMLDEREHEHEHEHSDAYHTTKKPSVSEGANKI